MEPKPAKFGLWELALAVMAVLVALLIIQLFPSAPH